MLLFGRKNKDRKAKDGSNDSFDRSGDVSGPPAVPITPGIKLPVLAVPLATAVKNSRCYDDVPLPAVVRQCIDYVEEHGLTLEGIYRVSAPVARLDELERLSNSGCRISFAEAHEAAGLLKRFVRQLPEHPLLFGSVTPDHFEAVAARCKCDQMKPCHCAVAGRLKEMLTSAPPEKRYLLAYMFIHALHVVDNSRENKMTLSALGVLFQAMFSVTKHVIRIFILNAAPSDLYDGEVDYIFDDIPFKRLIPPLPTAQIHENPPETLEALTAEIRKQENVFKEITDHILALQEHKLDTTAKEQEMWAVQQGITLLKRKIKSLTKENRTKTGDADDASTSSAASEAVIFADGPLLEKQLLAVQQALVEEVAEEQARIADLVERLACPPSTTNGTLPRPRMAPPPPPPPPKPPILEARLVAVIEPHATCLECADPGCDECHRQEARQKVLVDKIAKIRDECAQLRAKLEQSRETSQTVAVDAADDFGAPPNPAAVLVTRF